MSRLSVEEDTFIWFESIQIGRLLSQTAWLQMEFMSVKQLNEACTFFQVCMKDSWASVINDANQKTHEVAWSMMQTSTWLDQVFLVFMQLLLIFLASLLCLDRNDMIPASPNYERKDVFVLPSKPFHHINVF